MAPQPIPVAERLLRHFVRGAPNECWPWFGRTDGRGYGRIAADGNNGRTLVAHRVAWEVANGRKADGIVCHSCDNPACVNPNHLWLGTQRDNVHDMYAKGRAWQQKLSHCKNGHPWTPENTISGSKRRTCRTCNREASARYRLAHQTPRISAEKKSQIGREAALKRWAKFYALRRAA